MNSKLKEFYTNSLAYLDELSVIAITETWLSDSIYDNEIVDPNFYNLYRSNRDFSATNTVKGGGVLLAINRKLRSKPIDLNKLPNTYFSDLKFIDAVAVEISLHKTTLVIILVYIPPDRPTTEYDLLYESFECMYNLFSSNLVILGDFNIKEYNDCSNNIRNPTSLFDATCQMANFFSVSQFNDIPNENNRLLDLVFSNVDNCKVELPDYHIFHRVIHHPILKVTLNIPYSKASIITTAPDSKSFNFRKANYPLLYHQMSLINWDFLESINDVDDAVNQFYDRLNSVFLMCVPLKSSTNNRTLKNKIKNNNKSFPPWLTSDLKNAESEKQVLSRV